MSETVGQHGGMAALPPRGNGGDPEHGIPVLPAVLAHPAAHRRPGITRAIAAEVAGQSPGVEQSYRFGFARLGPILIVSIQALVVEGRQGTRAGCQSTCRTRDA